MTGHSPTPDALEISRPSFFPTPNFPIIIQTHVQCVVLVPRERYPHINCGAAFVEGEGYTAGVESQQGGIMIIVARDSGLDSIRIKKDLFLVCRRPHNTTPPSLLPPSSKPTYILITTPIAHHMELRRLLILLPTTTLLDPMARFQTIPLGRWSYGSSVAARCCSGGYRDVDER
jgi:hypothetical protein